jgi:mono/diheme cytochrome c family protein/predicted  nucleic acid-binding Zn-ribbon protein
MAKPLELENKTTLFFVCAAILAVTGIWAVYEEVWGRRPWKDYQQQLFALESERAGQAYERVKARLQSEEVQAELRGLEAQLAEARARITDPAKRQTFTEARRAVSALEVREYELDHDIKLEASRLDEAYYRYTYALHQERRDDVVRWRTRMDELEASIAESTVKLEAVREELEEARAAVRVFTDEIDRLELEIAALKEPYEDARARMETAHRQMPELTQVWLPDIQVVDRCHNCHAGINTCGYSAPEEVVAFALRQRDETGELSLAAERYCLDEETIEAWIALIDENALRGEWGDLEGTQVELTRKIAAQGVLVAEDGGPIDGVPAVLRTHPERWDFLVSAHPTHAFGCTVCHEGKGPQTKRTGSIWEGHEFKHGLEDKYWLWPLLDSLGDNMAQASCADCHYNDFNLEFADILNEGAALVDAVGCYGCHPIDGFPNDRKMGPELEHLPVKTNPGWVMAWLQYPKEMRPETSMPNFWPEANDASLSAEERARYAERRDREVEAITAYLWKHASGPEGYLEPAPPQGDAARGRELVESVGCYGCHAVTDDDPVRTVRGSATRAVAPTLAGIADKTHYEWLYNWVKDPARLWHDTSMPSLRLSSQEAADVATYLMTLSRGQRYETPELFRNESLLAERAEQGRQLIAEYGCFGCHDIGGFENAQRIGAELTDFGRKAKDLLDFGNAITNPREKSWENWTRLKLSNPRAYRTMRAPMYMPDFDFTPDEVHRISVFLKSRRNEPRPAPYNVMLDPRNRTIADGYRTLLRYNCHGCHVIDGEGGHIFDRYEENPNMGPPEIFTLGAKTQPDWLFHFLRDPSMVNVRPWLDVRMPSFHWHGDEASQLVSYFNERDEAPYPFIDVQVSADAEQIAAGRIMFEQLQCNRCHLTGDTLPPNVDMDAVSANLGLARDRLRPEWIPEWLADPAAKQPGSRMPAFWPDGMTQFPDLLGGDAQAQMEAVAAYLLSRTQPGRRTAAAPAQNGGSQTATP